MGPSLTQSRQLGQRSEQLVALSLCLVFFVLSACEEAPRPALPEITQTSASAEEPISDSGALAPPSTCLPRGAWTGVMSELRFARAEAGVSAGLDLDDQVSDARDPIGCFKSDLRGLSGEEGVDNQFSRIIPALVSIGGAAIEDLAQGVINQGRLLLMIELDPEDAPSEALPPEREQLIVRPGEGCLRFRLSQGLGLPEVGTDDRIIPGQSFDRLPMAPVFEQYIEPGEGGEFQAGPFSFDLPIRVFDLSLTFRLNQAWIVGTLDEEGASGFISAAIDVEEVSTLAANIEGGGMVAPFIENAVRQNADIFPDESGVCQGLSLAINFRATRAFHFTTAP